MRTKVLLTSIIIALFVLLNASSGAAERQAEKAALTGPEAVEASLGTAITYQGRLTDGGGPANGIYDFLFTLYNAEYGGAQVGSLVTKEDVPVNEGYFTVQLDFGAGVFINEGRWLEAAVRTGGSTGGYTTLSPRQALTPAPYAHYSSSAGSVPWSGVTGIPAGFADGVDNDTTNFWSLTGNNGTNPTTNYLGTSDNQPLEFRVNGLRALRLEPTTGTPNIVGGNYSNTVTAGVSGATISGGGDASYPNLVTDSYGTVGGGTGNQAGDNGGSTTDAPYATVGGGFYNVASGGSSAVGGGFYNVASGSSSAVGGGQYNEASGYASTVGGGQYNEAYIYAAVGGGEYNEAYGQYATVGGGIYNIASGHSSTVGGGSNHLASGYASTVGGGMGNDATGDYSTVGGGYDNIASGDYSSVGGGAYNEASGNYSFAAGRNANAIYQGSFVWADSNDFEFSSVSSNSFRARATMGFRLVTGIDDTGAITWSCSFLNGTSWACSSDRNMKENFQSVDSFTILEKLSNIPLQTWNAKGTDPNVRHLGPTAQDFYSAFGLGDDDTMIATIDLDGIALTAIQGLYQLSQEQAAEIQSLKTELAQMDKAEVHPANDRLSLVWVGISGFLAILVTVQAAMFFTLRRRMGGQA